MAAPAILSIDIIADATRAIAAMKKTGDAAKDQQTVLKTLGKTMLAAFSVGAVVAFGKSALTSAEEAASATANLENAFAAMGDTTGVAAQEAIDYASSLSKTIGVEDELIMAAQAQLATFSKVSDETARTAGVFDRATAAAADLAARGIGTLDSNSIMLGKALQDPVKGLTALGRAGVGFSKQQEKMIKTMIKAGDVTGAQGIVLAEVERQSLGAAEATATASAKMSVAWGEVTEQVGGLLLPAFTAFATFMVNNMGWVLPLAATLGLLVGAVILLANWAGIVTTATTVWANAQLLLNAVMAANPIGLVIIAIVALGAILVVVYKKSETFRKIVDAAFNAVLDAAKAVWNWIKTNWPTLLAVLTGPFGLAVLAIVKNWDTIKAGITAVIDWIKDKFNALVDFFSGLVSTIGGLVTSIVDAFKAPLNAVIGAWNNLSITLPRIEIPSWVPGIGGKGFGGNTIDFPNIPTLARGGVLTSATLFVGGEAGREIVTPERLLRQILRSEGTGSYTLNMYPRRADAADIAWGFRRLELLRTGR